MSDEKPEEILEFKLVLTNKEAAGISILLTQDLLVNTMRHKGHIFTFKETFELLNKMAGFMSEPERDKFLNESTKQMEMVEKLGLK